MKTNFSQLNKNHKRMIVLTTIRAYLTFWNWKLIGQSKRVCELADCRYWQVGYTVLEALNKDLKKDPTLPLPNLTAIKVLNDIVHDNPLFEFRYD